MADMPVVDAHAHVLSPRLRALGAMPSGVRVAGTGGGAEEYLRLLDLHGVGGAIIVGVLGDDDYLWNAFDGTEPARVWRVLPVEENPSAATVTTTLQGLSRPGVLGVRLRGLGPPSIRRPAALPAFPILRALAENGRVLWILMGADQHHLLLRVLDELPTLAGVLNHMGAAPGAGGASFGGRPHLVRPTGERRGQLSELAAHPDVRVILSGQYAISDETFPYADLRSHAEFLLDAFGVDRLLWGSDYPLLGTAEAYGEHLGWVRRTLPDLPEDNVAAIMGGNAWRLVTRFEADRSRRQDG